MNHYYFLAIIYGPVDPHTPRGRRHLTQRGPWKENFMLTFTQEGRDFKFPNQKAKGRERKTQKAEDIIG